MERAEEELVASSRCCEGWQGNGDGVEEEKGEGRGEPGSRDERTGSERLRHQRCLRFRLPFGHFFLSFPFLLRPSFPFLPLRHPDDE